MLTPVRNEQRSLNNFRQLLLSIFKGEIWVSKREPLPQGKPIAKQTHHGRTNAFNRVLKRNAEDSRPEETKTNLRRAISRGVWKLSTYLFSFF